MSLDEQIWLSKMKGLKEGQNIEYKKQFCDVTVDKRLKNCFQRIYVNNMINSCKIGI